MLKVIKKRSSHGHGFRKKLVVDEFVPETIVEVEETKIEIVEVGEPKVEPVKEVTPKAKSKTKK